MERRKFLIGAGSLAAGSAAAVGTGAFTSVSADRSISVEVAGDSSALLQIEKDTRNGSVTPNAQEYVEINSGEVSLDFSESGEGATGINDNATTVFDDLLKITNQGTQEVYVGYTHPHDANATNNTVWAIYHEDPNLDELEGGDSDGTTPTNNGIMNLDNSSKSDLAELEPGETLNHVGAYFTGKIDPSDLSTISADPVTFKAGDDYSDL